MSDLRALTNGGPEMDRYDNVSVVSSHPHAEPALPASYRWPAFCTARAFAVALIVLSAAVFGAVWAIGSRFDIPLNTFTRDAATANGGAFYGGYLSNFGMVLWAAATTACLFSGLLLHISQRSRSSAFLIASGLLTLLVFVDDFFLIHDGLAPVTIHHGDKPLFLLYAVCGVIWMMRYRTRIRETDFPILLLSIALFVTAVVFDIEVFHIAGDIHYVFEDGLKLLGIAAWTGYLLPISWREMRQALTLPKEVCRCS